MGAYSEKRKKEIMKRKTYEKEVRKSDKTEKPIYLLNSKGEKIGEIKPIKHKTND